MYRESHARSVAKAFSWRLFSTLFTSGLVLILTGRLDFALAVGGIEILTKIGLFVAHERLWNKIRFGKHEVKPAVLWLTGLSGAGKTTIAVAAVEQLRNQGFRAEHLDGDAIRSLFPKTGFTREEREAHIQRVGHLASILEKHGIFVIVSLVSPYADARRFVRGMCMNFKEVYLSTPLDVCEQRDVKGLYAKARRGEISGFTGIDDPYEPPTDPELMLDTSQMTVSEAVDRLLKLVSKR